MVNVIILAGGVGSRMKMDKPKQFIEVDGVPIIVRNIQNFQKNDRISNITIVCIESWIDIMNSLVEKYKLSKVNNIVVGGETGHDSTMNGVFSLKNKLSDDDYVIIHDAARPLLPQAIINDLLDTAEKYGNACSAIQCHDTVICTNDGKSGNTQIDRSSFMRVQTPQAYRYSLIKSLYERSIEDNIHNFVYANTMAIHYGTRIYFSMGFDCNVKITTKEDVAFYKALMNFDEEELIK